MPRFNPETTSIKAQRRRIRRTSPPSSATRWVALSKLRFVERLAGSSSGKAQQARRRCLRQLDNTVHNVPSRRASVFEADVNANRVSAVGGGLGPGC
jgi:hypothetical protein